MRVVVRLDLWKNSRREGSRKLNPGLVISSDSQIPVSLVLKHRKNGSERQVSSTPVIQKLKVSCGISLPLGSEGTCFFWTIYNRFPGYSVSHPENSNLRD